MDQHLTTDPDHYEECPSHRAANQPCYCEGISKAEDNYRMDGEGEFTPAWGWNV